jgi:ATP-dependent protease ClpP protease subunit
MIKNAVLILVMSVSVNCFADTFVDLQSGETFNGYILQKKNAGKTQVAIENKSPQYLDLSRYQITRNALGRKNKVYTFSITNPIDLECEVDVFEKSLVLAANQGPLLILINIDTPGGKPDLVRRICAAIMQANNCETAAFINGGKFGGGFSTAAIVALACDKVYMCQGTYIGAELPKSDLFQNLDQQQSADSNQTVEEFDPKWPGYCSAVADQKGRPALLARAMVDKNVDVFESIKHGKHFFVKPEDVNNKDPNQIVIRIWNKKGMLLTLNAAEAVKTGIADKLAASQDELLGDFEATKAAITKDTKVAAARREFEKIKRSLDGILAVIRDLEYRSANLKTQVDEIGKKIRGYIAARRESFGVVETGSYWSGNPGVNLDDWRNTIRARERLAGELLGVLDNQILNYRKAIMLTQKQPDLRQTSESLQRKIESAQATYRDVLSRQQFFY